VVGTPVAGQDTLLCPDRAPGNELTGRELFEKGVASVEQSCSKRPEDSSRKVTLPEQNLRDGLFL
jgi:hypothetical protein